MLARMKLVIQRVAHAAVEVEQRIVGQIGPGLLVLFGVTHGDTETAVDWLAQKLLQLRIFQDDAGKMNRSVQESGGSLLVVSQFTLYGDCSEGRRPSFTKAAPPELAKRLYEQFVSELRSSGLKVETGLFGADMKVSLINDGPVTFILEK